jgi:ATP-dependent DNA ligase
MLEGAEPSRMPGFIKPQLATLRSKVPMGEQWLHEIKYDGYRLQVHRNKARVTIYTRNGLDWTKRFSLIAGAFDIPVEHAIFDGEVVVIKDGRTNFSELQAALASGRQDQMVFYAFDLLYLDGFDLRASPQIERKRILKMLFDETNLRSPALYSDHLVSDGKEMFAHACNARRANHRILSSPICKNISISPSGKSALALPPSCPEEGRWPSSQTLGQDAVDAGSVRRAT